jgi:O-antigen/teichoic acid export membrane protein
MADHDIGSSGILAEEPPLPLKKLPWLQRLRSSPFFGSITRLGTGTVIGQALVVAATPLITRIYSPTDMGLMSIVVGFMNIAGIISTLRFELAIVSARDQAEALALLRISLMFVAFTAVIQGGALVLLIALNLLSYGTLTMWCVPLVVLALVGSGTFLTLRYYFVWRGDFSGIARGLVSQGVGRACFPPLLGVLGTGWLGLITGEAFARALGIAGLMRRLREDLRTTERTALHAPLWPTMKAYRQFPAIVLPSSILDAASSALPFPIVAALFGTRAAGLFFLAYQLSGLPGTLISASVADVFHNQFADAYRSDIRRVPALLRHGFSMLALVGIAVYLPTAVLSPFVLGPVLGGDWSDIGLLVAVMTPLAFASLVVGPASRLIIVVNRSDLKLFADTARLVIPIACLWGAHAAGSSFFWSVAVFSLTTCLTYFLNLVLGWYVSRHLGGPDAHD